MVSENEKQPGRSSATTHLSLSGFDERLHSKSIKVLPLAVSMECLERLGTHFLISLSKQKDHCFLLGDVYACWCSGGYGTFSRAGNRASRPLGAHPESRTQRFSQQAVCTPWDPDCRGSKLGTKEGTSLQCSTTS